MGGGFIIAITMYKLSLWCCLVSFSQRERERGKTDRQTQPNTKERPGEPGLGCEIEIEKRPTYPEGGGQAVPRGREALQVWKGL